MSATPVDAAFAALADPTRRAVLELLGQAPQRPGELASRLAISAPALSRHLRVLRRAGLVTEESPPEDARVRLYRLRPDALGAPRAWLDEVTAHWETQLASFAAHAERTRGGPR